MPDTTICKIDEMRQLVFGWANIALTEDGELVTDSQGDQIELADLEDAAYAFVLKFRESGAMHEGEVIGHLVESFVVTPEKLEAMGLAADVLPGGWWAAFHIEDKAAFAKVVNGDFSMFSIQGRALREEV